MRRTFLTTVLFGLVFSATAQNLVPNPSFELYNWPCSLGVGYQHLVNWSKPNCSIGGFAMSSCNSSTASVPHNLYGYAQPKSGDAYAVTTTFAPSVINDNPKNYMSVPLAQALSAGQEYCVALWASLADSSSHTTQVLHAYLTYGPLSTCNNQDLAWDQSAQITFDLDIIDSSQWHLLQSSFIADGGEIMLTLGSFLHGSEIDTVYIQSSLDVQTLYYIDDVYLGPCDAVGVEELKVQELVVCPNPAVAWIDLKLPSRMEYGSVRIVDMRGRVLKEQVVSGTVERLDVRDLADGVYQLLLLGKKGAFEAATTLVVSE